MGYELVEKSVEELLRRYLGEVLAALWEKGIKEPFEVHVVNRDMFEVYARRAKLLRIDEFAEGSSRI